MLLANGGERVPARIEHYEQRADVVPLGDCQELIEPAVKALPVLLVREIVQKHAHRVHPDALRPTELEVNALRIERFRLPHFELVDGCRRNEITPDEKRLRSVPVVRLLRRPVRGLRAGVRHNRRPQQQGGNCRQSSRASPNHVLLLAFTHQLPGDFRKARRRDDE